MAKKPAKRSFAYSVGADEVYVAFGTLVVLALLAGFALVASSVSPVPGPTVALDKIEGRTFCSGVHIGGGTILTAAHCTDFVKEFTVRGKGGDSLPAEVLWANKEYDVALVSLGPVDSLASAELSCRAPKIGETVTLEGNPLGLHFTRTVGAIMADLEEDDGLLVGLGETIWKNRVTASITIGGGNSGGPVYDASHKVVGIAVGSYTSAPTMAIIVPGSTICKLLAR